VVVPIPDLGVDVKANGLGFLKGKLLDGVAGISATERLAGCLCVEHWLIIRWDTAGLFHSNKAVELG
jgi:hypothetical protein